MNFFITRCRFAKEKTEVNRVLRRAKKFIACLKYKELDLLVKTVVDLEQVGKSPSSVLICFYV
jgi:hypothetical protein